MRAVYILLLGLVAVFPVRADLLSMGLGCISSPDQCGTAASGLHVDFVGNVASYDVEGLGSINISSSQVLFVFRNAAPGSTVHEIYFDDARKLFSTIALYEMDGVDYTTAGVSPSNLPDHNNIDPPFEARDGFSADIAKPLKTKGKPLDTGVALGLNDPDERLGILIGLGSFGYDDVLQAVMDGDLRIGLHVGDTVGEKSAAFVTVPPAAVPEPASVVLLGTMLAGVGLLFRKQI